MSVPFLSQIVALWAEAPSAAALNIMNTNRQVLTEKTARISFLRSPNRYITVGTIEQKPNVRKSQENR